MAEGKNANILSRVHFITLDLADIELGNLRDSQQNLAFSEKLARFVFKQLMDVLGYLHKKQFFHRDIKDDNIMLCKTKYVVFERYNFNQITLSCCHENISCNTQNSRLSLICSTSKLLEHQCNITLLIHLLRGLTRNNINRAFLLF